MSTTVKKDDDWLDSMFDTTDDVLLDPCDDWIDVYDDKMKRCPIKYSPEERLNQAIRAVILNKMNMKRAARFFNVNYNIVRSILIEKYGKTVRHYKKKKSVKSKKANKKKSSVSRLVREPETEAWCRLGRNCSKKAEDQQ